MTAAVVLALALALDSAAIAVARGAVDRRPRDGILFATLVGAFHGGFAALGWVAGDAVGETIAAWDHWVAFALLAGLGTRMIVASRRAPATPPDPAGFATYAALAIATSVDAAAAGVTLPLVGAPPAAIAVIAAIPAVLAGAAFAIGRRVAAGFGARLELAGGVVLIAVGVKILVEHLTA